jgi:hypothetical protein
MEYWDNAASTDSGLALTHLGFIIGLALDTGGRVTAIHEGGKYRGAVLTTSRELLVEGKLVKPLTGAATRKGIESFFSSQGTLAAIATSLSKLAMADGSPAVVIGAGTISTSPKLVEQVMLREAITEENVRSELEPLLLALRYDEDFNTVNQTNLISFLHGVKANETPSTPMWISIELLAAKDPRYFQLARFGSTAPSFFNPGGVKIDLYMKSDDDPKAKSYTEKVVKKIKGKGGIVTEKEEEVVRYGWETIYTTRRELPLAYVDLKAMINEKAIKQMTSEKQKSMANKFSLEKGSGPLLVALRDFGNDKKKPGKSAKVTLGKRKYEAEVDIGEDIDRDSDDDMNLGLDV